MPLLSVRMPVGPAVVMRDRDGVIMIDHRIVTMDEVKEMVNGLERFINIVEGVGGKGYV